MKLLILGATGRTGHYLLTAALERGHHVNVVVRRPDLLPVVKPTLTIFNGTPEDPSVLEIAMQGCDAVLVVLGIARQNDWPWAPLRSPVNLVSDVMKNLIRLAPDTGVKHIISCSAWGALESRQEIPAWFRWLVDKSNIGIAYRDHEQQEKILQQSNTRWTIVRPSGLTNSEKEEGVRISVNGVPKPSLTISRKTVAFFMLDCAENDNYSNSCITISRN